MSNATMAMPVHPNNTCVPCQGRPVGPPTLSQEALERILGFKVIDYPKYVTVFTHKSAMKLMQGDSYERYEFIGDAVINFVVAKLLFDMFPREDEGFLTRVRTKLVSGRCLSRLSWNLGLQNFIVMNQRSMRHGFNTNDRILEDVFEALVGCIYLQNGMVSAKTFLLNVFREHIDFNEMLRDNNYKDGLMRYAQARGLPLPEYTVVATSPQFTVRVSMCGCTGEGAGCSKKQAEQDAASQLLYHLGALTPQGDVAAMPRKEPPSKRGEPIPWHTK
jgi:ribonuclease III